MKGKIAFVVPDEKLENMAEIAISELKENIEIYQGSYSEGLRLARQAIKDGANIIISRGGTGNFIKKNVEIPVVNIEFGSYDVLNSLSKAVEFSKKIGVVGFSSLSLTFEKVSSIIEKTFLAKIITTTITAEREIEQEVVNLYNSGCRAFIGGQAVMDVLYKLH